MGLSVLCETSGWIRLDKIVSKNENAVSPNIPVIFRYILEIMEKRVRKWDFWDFSVWEENRPKIAVKSHGKRFHIALGLVSLTS